MKKPLFAAFILSSLLLIGCQKKEDLTAIQAELNAFQTQWLESGASIRQTFDSVKSDITYFHDFQVQLEKRKKAPGKLKPAAKSSLDTMLIKTQVLKDTITHEIQSFNEFTREWNDKKRTLTDLQGRVAAKTVTRAEADSTLVTLRNFREQAVQKLDGIVKRRENYKNQYRELQGRYKKDFS